MRAEIAGWCGGFFAACVLSAAAEDSARVDQPQTRIAVVDMLQLVETHPQTAVNRAELEREIDEFDAGQNALLEDLQELKEEVEKAGEEARSTALSETGRAKKKEVAEAKFQEFRDLQRRISENAAQRREELNERAARMRESIVSELRQLIETYAREQGYGLVLDGSVLEEAGLGTVMYREDRMDITEEILKRLEARHAGE